VLYRGEAADSGGAGQWRGGLGGQFAFMLHKTNRDFVHISAAFHVAIPNGGALSGGLPGSSVVYTILRDSNIRQAIAAGRVPQALAEMSGTLDVLPPKSQTTQGLDDVYAITFFGGGGYGDPLDRDLGRVAADVQDGSVTVAEAARLYGAVFTEGVLDTDASAQRRAMLREARTGVVTAEPPPADESDPPGSIRLNEHLRAQAGRIVCRRCGHDHCSSAENYKHSLIVQVLPVTALSPVNRDPAVYIDEPVEFRQFICPGCGTQVETEIALSRDPYLWDVQLQTAAP
jgi:N-methylhydantoinase B